MRAIITILILSVLVGCNLSMRNPDSKNTCPKKYYKAILSFPDSANVAYYQSDAFAYNAVKEYSIESVSKKYSNLLKLIVTPTENVHEKNVMDTIYNFSNDSNYIEFYRAGHADFIQRFDVSDSVFMLEGCVYVGLPKDSLKSRFGIKDDIGDTITIGNMEHSISYTFYFKNKKIKRIGSYQYID